MSGSMDDDNLQSTHLTILIPLVTMETDVTYGCKITYVTNFGDVKTVDKYMDFTDEGNVGCAIVTGMV